MTEEQIKALHKWLDAQTYSEVYGTDGEYLSAAEMKEFLPAAIEKILGLK